MTPTQLQQECEIGAEQLMRTEYRAAAATLARAEAAAWAAGDFDTLARVSLPLQEACRLTRQRCGEGTVGAAIVRPDLPPAAAADQWLDQYPCGQLLVYDRASVTYAAAIRRRALERGLYTEVFLAAWYFFAEQHDQEPARIYVVPLEETALPPPGRRPLAELDAMVPPGVIVLGDDEFPERSERGTPATYAAVMALWERLHAPYLAAAVAESDPLKRIELCRLTIRVDPACELAYQYMADAARRCRRRRP